MNIIAHRGDTTRAPGNTIEAFQSADEAEVFGFEFDVRLTKDEMPVVFHNMELHQTTRKGFLEDFTYAELQSMPVVKNGQSFHIPTLQEVLGSYGRRRYLEIHVQSYSRKAVLSISQVLKQYQHLWGSIEITSYEPAILLAFQETCEGIPGDLLFRPEAWMSEEIALRVIIEKAKLASARGVHLFYDQISESVLVRMARHNLEVHCGVVNDIQQFQFLKDLGVIQILTDNIHLFP